MLRLFRRRLLHCFAGRRQGLLELLTLMPTSFLLCERLLRDATIHAHHVEAHGAGLPGEDRQFTASEAHVFSSSRPAAIAIGIPDPGGAGEGVRGLAVVRGKVDAALWAAQTADFRSRHA